MENLFKDFYALRTFQEFKNKLIICIGSGGTGSAFIRDAARLMSVANEEGQTTRMVVCDADIVEDKNLKRQCFSPRDVGKNKAKVLAQRYSTAFNVDIPFVDEFIEDTTALNNLINNAWMNSCAVYIFSFVDNVKTRLMIHNYIHQYVRVSRNLTKCMWIDSGNSEFAGQVVAYSSVLHKVEGTTLERSSSRAKCPDVTEIKKDLLDPTNWDKFASELSCEDAAISAPQTMAANTTAANICLNMLFSILFEEKAMLDYNQVSFASNANVFRTEKLYIDNNIKFVGSVELNKEEE